MWTDRRTGEEIGIYDQTNSHLSQLCENA